MPHSVAVVIDAIQKREGGAVYINATIVVERASQKESSSENKENVKEVGKRARFDIEALLGSKVFLEVWVKVQKIGVIKCLSFVT